MTQDEIKEALETCILGYCTGCPYDGCDGDCRDELHKDVLTLITEQEKSIQMAQDSILSLAQQNQEYREQQVKQAQIDILNKANERLNAVSREIGKLKDENEALKNDLINSEGNLNHITTEFEQLKAENATLYEARNNLLEENDKLLKDNVALILDKKQAQIDVLNKAKERLDSAPNGWASTGYIDELIEEVER